ncbi:MAG: 3-hydroxyacyl-ACP dehydratase FabZ [Adlercreutzia equolifaciens]
MTEENAMAPLPWGREVIEGILPHRDPFVWVSRIMAIEPGASIEGELDVPADLDIFRGHFPDHPVLPGVIIMEALAQCASIAVLQAPELRGNIGFLTGIDAAKFRRQVAPGDTVTLRATIVKSSRRLVVAEVEASVDGEICATAAEVRARTQRVTMAKAASSTSASTQRGTSSPSLRTALRPPRRPRTAR